MFLGGLVNARRGKLKEIPQVRPRGITMKLKLILIWSASLLLAGCGALVTAPRVQRTLRVQRTPKAQKSPLQKILPKVKVEEEPEVERERVATLELINKAG